MAWRVLYQGTAIRPFGTGARAERRSKECRGGQSATRHSARAAGFALSPRPRPQVRAQQAADGPASCAADPYPPDERAHPPSPGPLGRLRRRSRIARESADWANEQGRPALSRCAWRSFSGRWAGRQRELVTSVTGEEIGFARSPAQLVRYGAQHVVSHGIAKSVVHRFQVDEIHQNQEHAGPFSPRERQNLGIPLEEGSAAQGPVWGSGTNSASFRCIWHTRWASSCEIAPAKPCAPCTSRRNSPPLGPSRREPLSAADP